MTRFEFESRPRLAWFAHRYAPCHGGAETYSRAMVSRFVAAGWQADVYTTNARDLRYYTDPRSGPIDAPRVESIDGATVQRLPVRHVPAQRYLGRLLAHLPHWPTRCRFESFMPIVPGLSQIDGPYDAVFAIGFPFTGFAYAANQLARRCNAPMVLTPFLHLSTPGDRLHRLYTREHGLRLLRQADLVVSPTSIETNFLGQQGIPAERRMVLPMAADRSQVTGGDRDAFRQHLGLPAAAFLVGQLGALDPDKGTSDLWHAVEQLNHGRIAAGDPPVHLVLAGQTSPACEALISESPRPWVHLLGPLPSVEVPDFYAGIDTFTMPSRTDSFGIVFLEAWANGRPVVAAAAGGVVEVVEDGRTGLLVPFGDPSALAAALNRLITHPSLARELGRNGLQRMASDGGWDERFARLQARVEPLLHRPFRQRPAGTGTAVAAGTGG
jgi:glycosyltransferase involved in cell wall biosynthesis